MNLSILGLNGFYFYSPMPKYTYSIWLCWKVGIHNRQQLQREKKERTVTDLRSLNLTSYYFVNL